MGKIALYRKYRPRALAEIVGQDHVTSVLEAAAGSGQFGHAYLFTGQRGTGKTSTARILAHLINDTPYDVDNPGTDLDIIEIDAASRGSVDDARELRDKSAIAPVAASHKIYIIDEVHMLSTPAFNALLKIIEEPPAHIVFILATTEIQKVPATILSRVQRFHFRPVSVEILANHLRQIADQEKIKIDDEALNLIAERGQGSIRDSISLLDQLSNSGAKITRATVEEILGLAPETAIVGLIDAITTHDVAGIVGTLNDLFKDGVAPTLIVDQLTNELSKLAPDKPKWYDLIEKLLEVAKSAAPDIKLTAVLAGAAAKNTPTTSAAIAAPPKTNVKLAEIIEQRIAEEESETIGRVQEKSVEYKSHSELAEESSDSCHPEFILGSSKSSSRPETTFSEDPSNPETSYTGAPAEPSLKKTNLSGTSGIYVSESEGKKSSEESVSGRMTKTTRTNPRATRLIQDDKREIDFDFAKLLAKVKDLDEPAVLATLKFADFDYADRQITLYFSKTFHRKKADTAKFRATLNSAFQELYHIDVEIEIAKAAVRENSDAAKILDIMGGGEVMRHGEK